MTQLKSLIVLGSLALSLFSVTACSSEKKAEDKTAVNNSSGAAETMEKSKDRMTTIEGQITFTNPTFDPSTGIQNVKLLRNGKVISQSSSNPDGTFVFKGKFDNGDYQIKVDSQTLVGSAPLKLNGYEVKDFVLPATLTAPKGN